MSEPTPVRRSGVRSLVLLIAVIALGLASRRYPFLLPIPIRKRTGDALWASAAFAGVGLLRPAWSTRRVAVVALGVAFVDEFSQAYHAPWIDSIRSHTLGHLFLGEAFYWLDLVAYVVGVLVVIPVDLALLSWGRPRRPAGPSDETPESTCVR
jgi:hypothetical protein